MGESWAFCPRVETFIGTLSLPCRESSRFGASASRSAPGRPRSPARGDLPSCERESPPAPWRPRSDPRAQVRLRAEHDVELVLESADPVQSRDQRRTTGAIVQRAAAPEITQPLRAIVEGAHRADRDALLGLLGAEAGFEIQRLGLDL